MKNKKENYSILWKSFLLHMLDKRPWFFIEQTDPKKKKRILLLSKEFNIFKDQFNETIRFLVDYNYLNEIEIENGLCKDYKLTKEGIEVALKLQEHKDNRKINLIIIYLSVILAMGAIAETSRIISFGVNWITCLAFIILFIALIFFGIKKLLK